jgi:hypothetical protein
MNTLDDQFNDALKMIELRATKRARAIEAHLEVRASLEADSELRTRGVDTVLIGSYKRSTSIRPGKDVDVFVKLPDAGDDPETLYQLVKDALVRRYKDRLTENRRSVNIDFGADGFSVDAVGAEPKDGHWAIPEADPAIFPITGERTAWEDTDPERLTDLTEARNAQPMVGDRGAYVPTVKLVRQTRQAHLADAKPGGLYFEILTYWAFEAGVTGGSFAEIFANTLTWIARRLMTVSSDPLLEPALMVPYAPPPPSDDLAHAAAVFTNLAAQAQAALREDDDCAASAAWRRILGENETGAVFALPEGCTEDGRRMAKIEPNPAVGPRSERGFA